jgi:hypothetical protein
MSYGNSGRKQKSHPQQGLSKPPFYRLLAYIISSVFSKELVSLLILGSAIIAIPSFNHLPSSNYLAVLICTILVLAFLRGCNAWQKDLDDYQKALSTARDIPNAQAR